MDGTRRPERAARVRRFLRLLGLGFGTLTLGLALLYAAHLAATGRRVTREFELLSSGGYYHLLAAPFRVRGGIDARAADLAGRLARAGLRRTFGRPSPGEMRVGHDAIDFRRADDDHTVTLELADGIVSGIRVDGEYTDWVDLPCEHLTSFRTSLFERRAPVPYSDMPQALIAAACGAEDRRFFEHRGVDMRGVLRALIRNLSHGRVVEGGSTITQQTVKVILNRTRRELPAKIDEAVLALLVEREFSKQQILAVYLNNVYLGHEGPFDIYGAAEGARFYFDKPLDALSDDENCQLAASIRAPNAASPRRNPERLAHYAEAIARAAQEVNVPVAAEVEEPRDSLSTVPLALATAASTGDRIDFDRAQLGYYMDVLGDEWQAVRKRYHVDRPAVIVASVDPVLQLDAAEGLVQGLEKLPPRRHAKDGDVPLLQGGVASIDPTDGAVRAVVGGRSYVQAPFNRAVNITRQVGSTFKPFVYLSAMGDEDGEPKYSQSTSLPDTLREYQVGQQVWAPANFDHQFRGWVTARQALEQSINAPTVALGMEVGVHRVAELADRVGVQDKVPEHPSILLGAVGTCPVRLASAYACFPNGGYAVRPYALCQVTTAGKVIAPERPEHRRVASSAGAYVVTDMLVGALRNGTGRSALRLGFRHLGAGKTGTSDQARDTWFVGFTPELVTAVWVGYDDNAPTGYSGSSAALPVWVNTMSAWLGNGWDVQFDVPPGIVFRNIDPLTGGMANSTCPDVEMAAYLDGTAPDGYCPLHSPSFGDRLDRMFGPDSKQPDTAPRKGIWDRFKSLIGA